jgi:dienelactone hydrolase
VTPAALPVLERLANVCIERWFDVFIRHGPTLALERHFLTVRDLASIEPWQGLLAQNSLGPLPSDVPVFITRGTTDLLVRPSVTTAYVNALCRNGSRVRLKMMQGVGHAFIARDAADDAVCWIAARFDGQLAPRDCNE